MNRRQSLKKQALGIIIETIKQTKFLNTVKAAKEHKKNRI